MGLQYAIEHFDEKLGNKLSTYAIPFIVGSVKRSLIILKRWMTILRRWNLL